MTVKIFEPPTSQKVELGAIENNRLGSSSQKPGPRFIKNFLHYRIRFFTRPISQYPILAMTHCLLSWPYFLILKRSFHLDALSRTVPVWWARGSGGRNLSFLYSQPQGAINRRGGKNHISPIDSGLREDKMGLWTVSLWEEGK